MAKYGISDDDVENLELGVSCAGELLCNPCEKRVAPLNGNDARYNLLFPLGATLVYGKPTLRNFTPEGILDERVIKAAGKITYRMDDEVDLWAKNGRGYLGVIKLTCKDGKVYEERCERSLGTPQNPMPAEEMFKKFQDCCGYSARPMPDETVREDFDMCMHIEDVEDIHKLTDLLS